LENKDSKDDNSHIKDVLILEESLFGKEDAHKSGMAFGKLLVTREMEGGQIWYEMVLPRIMEVPVNGNEKLCARQ
jgi:hypothetical protein